MAISLRTPRLVLREWRDADAEPFAAMSADREVMAMLSPLPDRAACDAFIARMRAHIADHGFAYWAVELPGAASFIGSIGVHWVDFPAPFTPAVEIGWRLARSHWGQGYATEAARAAIYDGFGRVGLNEIVAFTVPARLAPLRSPEALAAYHRAASPEACSVCVHVPGFVMRGWKFREVKRGGSSGSLI
jgi:RimJ/RimL family protein N-acetyltransferase